VSHDRAFLNEVYTSLLVFEGDGVVADYNGGYDDWQKERANRAAAEAAAATRRQTAESKAAAAPAATKARKLTNKERAELEAIPARIEVLEKEQAALTTQLADPAFFRQGGPAVGQATARLEEIERQLAAIYERWTQLGG
jgi:ATP-binding cassette subfamily F protein uup